MAPSARGSTHAYAYAGTNAAAPVDPDVSVNGSSEDGSDGSIVSIVSIAGFDGSIVGIADTDVSTVNITGSDGSTDGSDDGSDRRFAGPECSRDASADANFITSTARASLSVIVHGGNDVKFTVGRGGSLYATIDGSTDAS